MNKTPPIHDLLQDCPMHMLGRLKPPENPDVSPMPCMDDGLQVHGVTLPRRVVEELRRFGVPIGWYNTGELTDAVIACHYNSQLVDDPNGVFFRDKLLLSNAEISADNTRDAFARMRTKRAKNANILHCHDECDEHVKPGYKQEYKHSFWLY